MSYLVMRRRRYKKNNSFFAADLLLQSSGLAGVYIKVAAEIKAYYSF